MKHFFFSVGVAISSMFMFSGIAHAENPDHVRQLLQTNKCKGCDLSHANLVGLDLTEANLSGANLQSADLNDSQFSRANLKGANLQGATITGAQFIGANLAQANFANAKNIGFCSNPVLQMEQRSSTDSISTCLAYTLVSNLGAKLCEPGYGFQDLEKGQDYCQQLDDNGELNGGHLRSYFKGLFRTSSFNGADLTETNFQSVDLKSTDFRYASLNGTGFKNATLDYALLLNTNIQNVADTELDGAFVSHDAIKETIQQAIAQEKEAARQSEGRSTMGILSRAQQAFRLENNVFASRVSDLDTGISSTENFDYDVVPQSDPMKSAVMRATSTVSDLHSFIGIVRQGNDTEDYRFSILICKTKDPSMKLPTISSQFTQINTARQCPEGMEDIN